ncbi:coiled-coil domain-containing protein 84-like [Phytophthora cinnamomi]|uniref:coiled-coil domain-containing protein 84-like n=1 Tax=Phytophthora cinnamomi TaxID=4785 RepID=UPI0035595ACB|nr:coiled-coil domain-containing protein 84-like [Phytophthora cinnamomi]
MADDAAAEAPFCVACRRSSAVKWRKHVFSRGHQQAARQFLLRHAAKLQELCDAATADAAACSRSWWRCVFCDVALAAADAPAHFGGGPHRAQVEAFCRRHRCDADRQTRPQLWLQTAKRRELEAALTKAQDVEERHEERQQQETADQAAGERVEAFLASAASRLQEVQTERRRAVEETHAEDVAARKQQQEALLGPQLALTTAPRRCKTVSSTDGVLQNPLGRHEGRRVWGGGIVKLRKAEWIPWAIDQLVKEEQADRPETHLAGKDGPAFVHRVTELARGEGLSSIASVSWGAGVGNVHTAAVPPWMVQTEEEYKKCNHREQAALTPTPPTRTNRVETEATKRRDIFSELQSKSEYGPDWLPNFGGVWQEGPRSKTKQAFRKATDKTSTRGTSIIDSRAF